MLSYAEEYTILKELYRPRSPIIRLPFTPITLNNIFFRSRSTGLFPPGENLTQPDMEQLQPAGLENSDDAAITENAAFTYPLFMPAGRARASEAILLFHGLNERSWHKYLPWGRTLCERTGKAVLLFPLSFHMNRAPKLWSSPHGMMRLARWRQSHCASLQDSSFANAALSARLERAPLRFFTSGLNTYLDVLQLVREVRSGTHPLLDSSCSIDFFGYSIGALLAEVLLMSDPEHMFSASRAFLFCGGATLDQLNPVSRAILDSSAGLSLRRFYGSSFVMQAVRFRSLNKLITRLRRAFHFFVSLLRLEGLQRERELRLGEIGGRITALALERDTIAPPAGVQQTLKGTSRALPVRVEVADPPYPYNHVNPFPYQGVSAEQVHRSFQHIFSYAADFLSGVSVRKPLAGVW